MSESGCPVIGGDILAGGTVIGMTCWLWPWKKMAEKRGGDLWDAGRQGMERAVKAPIWFLKPCPRQDVDSMGEEGTVGDTEITSESWGMTRKCLSKNHNKETKGSWHELQVFEQGGNWGRENTEAR